MAKKPPKGTPHLRVRIEPKLLAKLEKARVRNGHTLTGEIVVRLEQTFDTEDRVAAMESHLSDLRRLHTLAVPDLGTAKWRGDIGQKREASENRTTKTQEISASAKMVDVLLGEDKQKSELLRRVALQIASWPQDWTTNPSIRKELEQRFRSTFATQIGEDVQ